MNPFIVVSIVVFYISIVVNLFVRHISLSKSLFLDRIDENKPQKFHKQNTPRAGGISIFLSFLIGSLLLSNIEGIKLLLASTPLFFSGLVEDLKRNVKPSIRLLFAFVSAAIVIILTGLRVENISFIHLPYLVSLGFTIFAVAGVANSINIIDGFNGLASGFSIIASVVFTLTFYKLHDLVFFEIGLILIFSTLGFFVLNFPKGLIFLGDSGAYFLGFMLAELAVALAFRHPEVSPFYCLAVMIYPVWEVIFSFYRRKILKGYPATSPDKMHFHTVLFRKMNLSNYMTSSVILTLVSLFEFILFFYSKRETLTSILFTLIFIISYNMSYHTLVWSRLKKILRKN